MFLKCLTDKIISSGAKIEMPLNSRAICEKIMIPLLKTRYRTKSLQVILSFSSSIAPSSNLCTSITHSCSPFLHLFLSLMSVYCISPCVYCISPYSQFSFLPFSSPPSIITSSPSLPSHLPLRPFFLSFNQNNSLLPRNLVLKPNL